MSDWRYIATRLNGNGTETVLHNDLPLSGVSVTDTLSGAQAISANIVPEEASLRGPDGEPIFDPWSTAIYAEKDGQIRGGAILDEMLVKDSGASLGLQCVGFAGYPKGMPYTGEYSKIDLDPIDAFREVWRHLQAQTRGNLGVIVDAKAKSPVRLGTKPAKNVKFDTKAGENVSFVADGPYVLAWYKTTDLYTEVQNLARDTPFEYREVHSWGSDDKIIHRIEIAAPTLGRRRDDLRFMVGENVFEPPDVLFPGDYASEVLVLGAGEGAKTKHATVARSSETRIRRAIAIDVKDANTDAKARSAADLELKARFGRPEIDSLVVVDHPHAKLGSFSIGDEIFIQYPDGWQGDLGLWVRITSLTIRPDSPSVVSMNCIRVDRI